MQTKKPHSCDTVSGRDEKGRPEYNALEYKEGSSTSTSNTPSIWTIWGVSLSVFTAMYAWRINQKRIEDIVYTNCFEMCDSEESILWMQWRHSNSVSCPNRRMSPSRCARIMIEMSSLDPICFWRVTFVDPEELSMYQPLELKECIYKYIFCSFVAFLCKICWYPFHYAPTTLQPFSRPFNCL